MQRDIAKENGSCLWRKEDGLCFLLRYCYRGRVDRTVNSSEHVGRAAG